MKLLTFYHNKVKLFNVTIFKIKQRDNYNKFYVCGILVWKRKDKCAEIHKKFDTLPSFYATDIDNEIASLVSGLSVRPNIKTDQKKVAFLATALGDMGGHTKCIRDLAKSFSGIYQQALFLTQKEVSYKSAPKIIKDLENCMSICGDNVNLVNFSQSVRKFAQDIIDYAPKALLVYTHPDDIFGVAVLSLIKKRTDIKVIFFNHASHFPTMGMSFADVILEGMPATEKVTHELRGFKNTKIVGLQSLGRDDTIYYPQDELDNLKKQIGIPENAAVTLSGGSGYKFFEKDVSSEYFEMIKRLLLKEKSLYHVVISRFDRQQQQLINEIFKNDSNLRKRLIILPFQPDFDKYFQCADVFVDSFPVSSALTQIDLMRNKVASVVKINNENPEFSFHEYQMPDYPYMFEKVEDMENAVLELLHNPEKRKDIIIKNYEYWLKTYESDIVRDKYIKIIEAV